MGQSRPLEVKLGTRIKYLRILRGMTQEELAGKSGLSAKQISRIETGRSSPRISGLDMISTALKTTPLNLFLNELARPLDLGDPGQCNQSEACQPANRDMCIPVRLAAWILDEFGAGSLWSESMYRILGYPPFVVRPTLKRFLSCVVPKMRAQAEQFICQAGSKYSLTDMMVPISTKNGKHRILMLSVDRFWPDLEMSPLIQLIVKDVTECLPLNRAVSAEQEILEQFAKEKSMNPKGGIHRSQTENLEQTRLMQELKTCRQAIDCSPAPVLLTDPQARLRKVNPALVKAWGYESGKEIHGMHLSELLCPSVPTADIIQVLISSGIWQGRLKAVKKDGTVFLTRKLASSVQDDHGRLIGFASIFLPASEAA